MAADAASLTVPARGSGEIAAETEECLCTAAEQKNGPEANFAISTSCWFTKNCLSISSVVRMRRQCSSGKA